MSFLLFKYIPRHANACQIRSEDFWKFIHSSEQRSGFKLWNQLILIKFKSKSAELILLKFG